jgi:hypothetical protein
MILNKYDNVDIKDNKIELICKWFNDKMKIIDIKKYGQIRSQKNREKVAKILGRQ